MEATTSILDAKTERFMLDQAASIGLITRSWESQSITMTLKQKSIEVHAVTTHEIGDVVVTVYRYLPAVYQSTPTNNDQTDEEDAYFYAAEWPIRAGKDSLRFTTYVFDQLPEKQAIETAEIIHMLTYGFWFGDLEQRFECRHCSETSHWLSITSPKADRESLSLRDRLAMVANRNCGCHRQEISATALSVKRPYPHANFSDWLLSR